MTLNQAINEIMPLVIDSDRSTPFILFKINGKWTVHYPYPADSLQDFLLDAQLDDPYAVSFAGADFSQGSASSVYDTVLCRRLRAEYERSENKNEKEANALLNFFEDNVALFSQKTTDYLTAHDKPFTALNEMCSISLATDNAGLLYCEDVMYAAIERIENEVNDRLNSYPNECEPEKRHIESYEEKMSIRFAGITVVLAENPACSNPYLICNIKAENAFALEERYNAVVTDNFIEAMREFVDRVDGLIATLEVERKTSGLPFKPLTAADCIENCKGADYESKLVIVKAEYFAPEYRSAEYQLIYCTGGFGSKPDAYGRAVFGEELHSGKKCSFVRRDMHGLADLAKLPEWAVKKLNLLEETKKIAGNIRAVGGSE